MEWVIISNAICYSYFISCGIVSFQLYITGLTIGEDTGNLNLGDLIFGVGGDYFDSNTDYKDMILKYNRGTYGRVYREHDFEQICKNAKKEGTHW